MRTHRMILSSEHPEWHSGEQATEPRQRDQSPKEGDVIGRA